MKSAVKLFLSPSGRMARIPFIIGIACFTGFVFAQKYVLANTGTGIANFLLGFVLFFLNLHIIMAVFGKRLHDLGRSFWPLIGLFALMAIMFLVLILNYGGIEYFDTVMAHPEYAGNEEAMQKVLKTYQDRLAQGLPRANWIMAALPALFILWLALVPGQAGKNRYG
ncbi:MAG: hypothetical protein COA91_09535 [Robiginitomaculum sp.]|nr:MAG: hypothetical protein COA91_09535 [Robiginitomaculum sp.]